MRIVTIGAIDGAFVHAMLVRQLKAGSNVEMTFVTDLTLLVGQQVSDLVRVMDGMATDTAHLTGGMRRPADVHFPDVFGVAGEATVENLVGRKIRKTDDPRFIPHSFDMQLARAVTTLAARFLQRRLRQCDRFEVGVAIEAVPQVGMAGLADLAADVLVGIRRRLGGYGRETNRGHTDDARE